MSQFVCDVFRTFECGSSAWDISLCVFKSGYFLGIVSFVTLVVEFQLTNSNIRYCYLVWDMQFMSPSFGFVVRSLGLDLHMCVFGFGALALHFQLWSLRVEIPALCF